ncbi:MAG: nucleotidyl transferase AbiEii/AbiGii toxin family protein [candidate division KSB1 bacterium]|nr:nucleotidyl transferase AbiEii/AbiGii toxin family protein [candidate division KSB1 bacterium]MDZ7303967.1 nucleotidyl transferase AbiEii/AbiGii toxin family protein [candidate division KSB1 bacterium]MDZ7313687.1 nucleotidyl transferase AbiEii/AbiGii toxin family protein [candidate division KSB1 bacterium]
MPTILTPLQNSFLTEFFHLTQDFYLTGGTALSAFYLQHRYSIDLDLFTHDDYAFQRADDLTNQASTKLNVDCKPVRITSYFKHFRVGPKENPVTIHFSKDYAAHIKPPNQFEEILIDSIEDITVNKICAALGRTEIKDLIDLYFLDKAGYSIPNYFDIAQQKDGGLAYETLAYTLSQFKISEIPPFMIKPLTVEELKQYQETTIEWLIRKSAPPIS